MNKIGIQKLAAIFAAAVMIPAAAMAQGPGPQDQDGPGGMGRMGMMHDRGEDGGMRGEMRHGGGHGGLGFLINNPEMRKRLGITDEQAAKIRQQSLEFRKAEIRNRAELQVKRLELHSLIAADTPDRAAIDRSLQEVGAAQMAVEKSGIDFHLAMRSALTPEQREKLKAMREEFGHRGAGGPHGQGGPGGGHGMMRHSGQEGAPPPPPPQQ
jgi:Spy/CpxP family protein refolding chaperone